MISVLAGKTMDGSTGVQLNVWPAMLIFKDFANLSNDVSPSLMKTMNSARRAVVLNFDCRSMTL